MRRALTRVDVASAKRQVDSDALEEWGLAGPTLGRRCVAEPLAEAFERLERTASPEFFRAA